MNVYYIKVSMEQALNMHGKHTCRFVVFMEHALKFIYWVSRSLRPRVESLSHVCSQFSLIRSSGQLMTRGRCHGGKIISDDSLPLTKSQLLYFYITLLPLSSRLIIETIAMQYI